MSKRLPSSHFKTKREFLRGIASRTETQRKTHFNFFELKNCAELQHAIPIKIIFNYIIADKAVDETIDCLAAWIAETEDFDMEMQDQQQTPQEMQM